MICIMKKIITVILFLAVVSISKAQWFDFSTNNEHATMGFAVGKNALGTDYSNWGFGIGFSVFGFYGDFFRVTPEYEFDKHVHDYDMPDSSSWALNIGYQIPVLPWLRIAPIIGYSQANHGVTDFSSVNIETDGETSRIYHDYIVEERYHYFNYGLGVFVQPFWKVEFYAIVTRRAIYGGIGLNLLAFPDAK